MNLSRLRGANLDGIPYQFLDVNDLAELLSFRTIRDGQDAMMSRDVADVLRDRQSEYEDLEDNPNNLSYEDNANNLSYDEGFDEGSASGWKNALERAANFLDEADISQGFKGLREAILGLHEDDDTENPNHPASETSTPKPDTSIPSENIPF